MPTRTYQVNYDITANTAGALRQFQELQMPMAEVAKSARAAQESLTMVVETAQRLKSLCNNGFVLKPTINTKSFADALATMEANVKASSMRMRASLEAALSGSSKDHERINNLLGAGNWKKAASEQTHEVEKMERNLKLLRNLNSKYSRGTSANAIAAKKEADAYFSALQSSGVDGMKRAQNLLKSVGLGNILFKDDKGWNFAGGDSKTKLKDYIKNLESQYTEANKSLQKAIAKNKSTFGNIQNQTAFNKKGSFIERMLGVSPEQMKEMAPALNAINSMMGGVQQTQEKIQNIVKKTPIPKPIAPKDLPSNKMMRDLQSQIKAEQNKKLGVWARDNELKSWEMLEKAGKLDKGSKAKKTYETLKKQRKIWASSQLETMASDSEIAAKQSQLAAYQKQRGEYASQLRNWRAKPFTETVEQVKVAATEARKATAQPVNLNIGGNFTKKIQPLINLAKALTSIPKEPVDVAVNVNVNNGAVDALKAIKTNLQGINTARANIARGGFGKIEKLAEITAPKTEKIVGNASVKAVLDRTTLGGDLRNSTNNLTKLSKENFVRMKAVLDRTSLGGDLRTSINNLNRIAREYPIRLRAALDRTSLGGDLRSSIGNLTKLAKERPLKIKAEFDGAALKQSVTKTLNGLKTKKNVPTIKLALDTSEATAALNKLLSSIKAASPQNIKLGATATGQGGRGGSVGSGSRGGVGGGGVPPTSTNRTSYGGNISNIAATGAAMRSGMSSSKPGVVDRLRKSVYPLTGNVSLGASTPVALDMAKGMGVMYGVGGAMNLVTGGLTEAMEYQNTMETAEEILKRNYSGKDFNKDFKDMSAEVRRVAKQTKFTAPQAADATRFMAMAGLSIPMIKASVSPVADVAVIGDNDFGEVADKMTNIQTAFQIAQQKMRHVADALTNTFTKTNTDMMMLAESMQYAAPMAHLSGLSLEDTLAMVGVMGNSGIQASMAGTTLRMMLQNTLNPNKKQAALWKRLGVSTRNGDGSLRNMINILADVKEAQKRSKLTMADVVSNLFRVTASAGAGAVINNIGEVRRLSWVTMPLAISRRKSLQGNRIL